MFHYLATQDVFHDFTDNRCEGNGSIICWVCFASFLNTGDTKACFHCVGTVPESSECWKIWVNIGIIYIAVALRAYV